MKPDKPFNRERFLLFILAGLLGWQAAIFTFGVVLCSRVQPHRDIATVCPQLGDRYDKFVQTTLGAVLGLLAGAAAIGQIRPSGGDGGASSQAPPQLPPEGSRSPGRARKSQRPEPPEEG